MDIVPEEDWQPADDINPDLHQANFLRRYIWITAVAVIGVLVIFGAMISFGLAPVQPTENGNVAIVTVKVTQGQSFFEVAKELDAAHLLRSRLAFETEAFLSGAAFRVQTGTYRFSPAMSSGAMLRELSGGAPAVTVTITEGSDLYEIDKELADAGVINRGDLISFTSDGNLEGKLFPDTYQFFEGTNVADVVQKFLDNFNEKAAPLLAGDSKNAAQDLTLASIIEKEAPDQSDQSVIAGIIKKRIADGMRLQIDATVCYAKQMTLPSEIVDCSALTRIDFSPNSPYRSAYNTYLHTGLPPGPIGNPGTSAITAALHPVSSSYLYYMSDPATGKTMYAATLAEQNANIKKYLGE